MLPAKLYCLSLGMRSESMMDRVVHTIVNEGRVSGRLDRVRAASVAWCTPGGARVPGIGLSSGWEH